MFCAHGDVGMAGKEMPGTDPQLPGDAHLGTGFFFFFSFNDNSQETWESGGRSSSNRHIWRGRKGLEERTSTQAEVNMANSKLLGDNFFPNPCWHPPLWEEQGNEADDKWTRRAKEHSWWFWTWLWQHKDFLPHGVGSGLTGLRCR